MITELFAQMASEFTTANGILMMTNGALTVALRKIYLDCKTDRERLWRRIAQLESKLTPDD